ncbi:MAG TPA: ATP-dependent zinc metalloprotease FtsH [Casimicrobiaceae bacterium]|nr:ATP-dependent zinc metalloprotease FtsH [Casimicrobiaceae bacterium]
MNKTHKLNAWYLLAAILGVLFAQQFFHQASQTEEVPYSTFEKLVAEHQVARIVVTSRHIVGYFKTPQNGKTQFVTTRVDIPLVTQLKDSGIEVTGGEDSGPLATLISWVAPAVVFFAIWFLLYRRFAERMGATGLMSIGKSRAKVYVEKDTSVTFNDVAGATEAKQELHEVIDFLKNPKEYGRLGARIPKGILLVGPPGTGKTLLARAVAGEAGVPFFSISGSEFVEMFVGLGAARVRDLFAEARKQAPAIIFIDELDSLGRARNSYGGIGGHDEREQTLNQLLAELDGFDPREGVVLLSATNRPEILDPALLRAGRFDRQILVDRPDKRDRIEIVKVHTRKLTLAPDVDPEKIAALTPGFTGADIANLANEAALLATRRRAQAVSLDDFTRAVERIVAGLEKRNRLLIPKEREIVAYHEMGHALVALALPGTETIHKVSIIPRGIGALGYTIQRPTEDRFLMTRQELESKIATLLGGRAAEMLVFGAASTGAADDLAKATDIARGMVAHFGMDENLGAVSYETDRSTLLGPGQPQTYLERRYSEATAQQIDAALKRIIDQAFGHAAALLREHRSVLDAAAKELLEKETLDEDALRGYAAQMTGVASGLPSGAAPPAAGGVAAVAAGSPAAVSGT